MPRSVKELSAKAVQNLREPKTYAVGGTPGLLLVVRDGGARSWLLRYTFAGRRREMGLGSYPEVSLAEARERGSAARRAASQGEDPIAARQQQKAELIEAAKPKLTVAEAVDLAWKAQNLKGEKNSKRWRGTLMNHVVPALGADTPLEDVTVADVEKILLPLWTTKHETAVRVRVRLSKVFRHAIAKEEMPPGFVNPCRWEEGLAEILPKVRRGGGHQPSIPWKMAPSWYSAVSKIEGVSALVLRFIALTAVRSGEALKMTDAEVDLDAGLWVVPAERTKTSERHAVPLSRQAIELIKASPRMEGSPFVFPAPRGGHLSNMSPSMTMRRLHAATVNAGGTGWPDEVSGKPAVAHGLRSTFRVWAAEHEWDPVLASLALGHQVGSAVERAYQRSKLVEKRREMMQQWADFVTGAPSSETTPKSAD